MHIGNLYKYQDILLFKECYALEKIDGTSCHIFFDGSDLHYFSGGTNHEQFLTLFNHNQLLEKFKQVFTASHVIVFGEGYGGKIQGQSKMYGTGLRFVAFDVKVYDSWLDVPKAESLVKELGLEFVHYVKVPTDVEVLNRERDRDSVQAIRNGMGEGHESEGVILRPLIEVVKNSGKRVITKHKKDSYRETAKKRKVVDPAKLEKLKNAKEIADEWVTKMRLNHVNDKLGLDIIPENIPKFIHAMFEDIRREGDGEIEWTKEAERAIGNRTAYLVKEICKQSLEV